MFHVKHAGLAHDGETIVDVSRETMIAVRGSALGGSNVSRETMIAVRTIKVCYTKKQMFHVKRLRKDKKY